MVINYRIHFLTFISWFPSPKFHPLTTMQGSWSSLHNRGAATIQTDYTQLGIPNHTIYAGLKPTYINLHSDPPKRGRVQRHPTA
jgi:hypothetical protein